MAYPRVASTSIDPKSLAVEILADVVVVEAVESTDNRLNRKDSANHETTTTTIVRVLDVVAEGGDGAATGTSRLDQNPVNKNSPNSLTVQLAREYQRNRT
jgi:hypothetical protein